MMNAADIITQIFQDHFQGGNQEWISDLTTKINDIDIDEHRYRALLEQSTLSLKVVFERAETPGKAILIGLTEPWSKLTQFVFMDQDDPEIPINARDIAEDVVYNVRLLCSESMPESVAEFLQDLEENILMNPATFPNNHTRLDHTGKNHLSMLPLDW